MNNQELNLAGKGQRIINVLIDMIVFVFIWIVITVVLLVLGFNQTYTDEIGEKVPLIPLIILLPTFWGYYVFTEYKFQKTVGKLLTKTKVVSLTGEKPTLLQIIFRTLSRSIPFEYFSYFISVEGIHDRISKTRVVNISS
jgi:uncharacterized RDD family membrane protein YckC